MNMCTRLCAKYNHRSLKCMYLETTNMYISECTKAIVFEKCVNYSLVSEMCIFSLLAFPFPGFIDFHFTKSISCCPSFAVSLSSLLLLSISSPVFVGVKTAYSPAPSTVYNQPPPPQRQVTALKPLAISSPASTSYNIYPVSTSVQQPQTPISSYTLGSSFSSSGSATSYSGK